MVIIKVDEQRRRTVVERQENGGQELKMKQNCWNEEAKCWNIEVKWRKNDEEEEKKIFVKRKRICNITQ